MCFFAPLLLPDLNQSAFINTLLTTFSARLKPASVVLSQTGGTAGDAHVTFAVQRLQLPNTLINIIDVWGEATGADNDYASFLDEMLRGHVRDGTTYMQWEKRGEPPPANLGYRRRDHPKFKHRIHACIYVTRASAGIKGTSVQIKENFDGYQEKLRGMRQTHTRGRDRRSAVRALDQRSDVCVPVLLFLCDLARLVSQQAWTPCK